MTKKVLIIGSGNRIRNSFFPALQCLAATHSIVGLYSRTPAHRQLVCKKWGIKEVTSLEEFAFSEVDLVIMSISTHAVPKVLQSIGHKCSETALLIDTPVFMSIRSFLNIRSLKMFKRVLVAEDFIQYPHFKIMRDVIKKQTLGDIRKIELYRTGYEYHGLALIRSFLNLAKVRSVLMRTVGDGADEFTFKFDSGISGTIVEPYSRFDGWIKIEGEKQSLIYDPCILYESSAQDSISRLQHRKTDDGVMIFSIDGIDVPTELQPDSFQKLQSLEIEDTSDFNTFKSCGLVSIINSASSNESVGYTLAEGLYDSLASLLYWRQRRYPDVVNRALLGLLKNVV